MLLSLGCRQWLRTADTGRSEAVYCSPVNLVHVNGFLRTSIPRYLPLWHLMHHGVAWGVEKQEEETLLFYDNPRAFLAPIRGVVVGSHNQRYLIGEASITMVHASLSLMRAKRYTDKEEPTLYYG